MPGPFITGLGSVPSWWICVDAGTGGTAEGVAVGVADGAEAGARSLESVAGTPAFFGDSGFDGDAAGAGVVEGCVCAQAAAPTTSDKAAAAIMPRRFGVNMGNNPFLE